MPLNAIADSGGTVEHRRLTDRMTATLKIAATVAQSALSEPIAAGLLEELPGDAPRLVLTAAGRGLWRRYGVGTAEITARLHADLPAEDLAAAGRVPAVVTARAGAALAGG
ncbi:hypothetical protein P8A22_03290 [Streptomyces laculatispora]|uniref:Uncharacterized protein n=1 Tax=Streptomyces laculatispora TaxID=887464 RepID=A0ABY9HXQ1_9ACTN|nr:hypothetical protein [Streptomyces laculatispora]WLQ39139.1 hypothetical protein P8A22_03290 [Streptomyces laculatispora]